MHRDSSRFSCFASTILVFAFLALGASAHLQAQTRDEDGVRSFVDSIAAATYAAAWPTASYKKASIKSTSWVEGGYDVSVRLLGESAFGGDLWLDLVFEIRNGGLSNVRIGGHNAILVPPFETTKALGAVLEDLIKEYESGSANRRPAPSPAAPTYSAGQAGAVCLRNQSSEEIKFSYRWGEGAWQSDSVAAKTNSWYWWTYSGNNRTSPQFYIRFDDNFAAGYTETSYWLPRAEVTLPVKCEAAMQFQFVVSGPKIDLQKISQ
jgi:hypothetical protein